MRGIVALSLFSGFLCSAVPAWSAEAVAEKTDCGTILLAQAGDRSEAVPAECTEVHSPNYCGCLGEDIVSNRVTWIPASEMSEIGCHASTLTWLGRPYYRKEAPKK
jgi:small ligand-binding sensory domain FIST